jgi:hypothetical protein
MTEMTIKAIRYVRACRCALDNFVFPFAILFFLIPDFFHAPQALS